MRNCKDIYYDIYDLVHGWDDLLKWKKTQPFFTQINICHLASALCGT